MSDELHWGDEIHWGDKIHWLSSTANLHPCIAPVFFYFIFFSAEQ